MVQSTFGSEQTAYATVKCSPLLFGVAPRLHVTPFIKIENSIFMIAARIKIGNLALDVAV